MLSILNRNQEYGLFRALMCREFEADFVLVLSSPELMTYLKLNEEDIKSLRQLAAAEMEELKSNLTVLNRKFFKKLCDALPPESRQKMSRLFENNWK